MDEIREYFLELEKVMKKYDLYQEDDEVGETLEQLRQAIMTHSDNLNWK